MSGTTLLRAMRCAVDDDARLRVDFPDGSYVVGSSRDHFTITTKPDTPLVSTTTGVELTPGV